MHFIRHIRRFFVLFLIVVCAQLGAQQHNLTIFIDQKDDLHNKIFARSILNRGTILESETLTVGLFYALHQKATPILCVNGHIFEHIIIRLIGFQKKLKANKELQNCFKKLLLGRSLLNTAVISKKIKDPELYKKFLELCFHVQSSREFDEDVLFDFACFMLLKNIDKDWSIFRSMHVSAENCLTSYLLIPKSTEKSNSSNVDQNELIKEHGLNPQFFKYMSLAAISQEIIAVQGYSNYVTASSMHRTSDRTFSSGVMEFLNTIFISTQTDSRSLYFMAHGSVNHESSKANKIIGLNQDIFLQEILPFFIKHKVHHAFLNSCEIGGIIRDCIKVALDKLNEQNRDQFPMTIILGGMPDCKTSLIGPLVFPTNDENLFYKLLQNIQPNDKKALDALPFFQSIRFDTYFLAFDFVGKQRLQKSGFLEQFLAQEIAKSSPMINQVIKSMTPFYCYGDYFLVHCLPQILTNSATNTFKAVEIDDSMAVISQGGLQGDEIIVSNKKTLVVEPQNINVPLKICNCLPQILSMESGHSLTVFESIHVESSECLQSILEKMFFAEKNHRAFTRAFWIKKFTYGDQEIQNLIVGFDRDETSIYYQKMLNDDQKIKVFHMDLEKRHEVYYHESSQESMWFYSNLKNLSNSLNV